MFKTSTNVDPTTLLNGQEAHLWLVSTDQFTPALEEELFHQLTPIEQNYYCSLRIPKVKREYLATRALIRHALSYYAEVKPTEWEFIKSQNGRPQLTQRFSDFNLNFNITHSDGAVACLIACGHQVGVDIESRHRQADFFDFADTVLSEFEQSALAQQSHSDFLHYWTLKEAYSKALSLGLGINFKDIVCVFGEEDCTELRGYYELPKEKWQLLQTSVLNNHLLAIAINKATTQDIAIRLMDCGQNFHLVQSGSFMKNAHRPIPRLFTRSNYRF